MTVTDASGIGVSKEFRNSGGGWIFDSNVCTDSEPGVGYNTNWGIPIGGIRYRLTYNDWTGNSWGRGYCGYEGTDCFVSIKNNQTAYGFPYDPEGTKYIALDCVPATLVVTQYLEGSGYFGKYVLADYGERTNTRFKLDKYIWDCP